MNRLLFTLLVIVALVSSACGSSATDIQASPEAMLEAIGDHGGSIIFYASIDDQILDSDAVVAGRITGVESAREEMFDDGSEQPFQWVHVSLAVTEVIHTSRDVKVEVGQVLRIEMPKPDYLTLDEVNRTIPPENEGIHFLFNGESLLSRMGEKATDADLGVWVYQNGSSMVLDNGGRTIGAASGKTSDSYSDFIKATMASARSISGKERPITPIGLAG